eukprot:TRINITY_DN10989_c0_g1_i2.p1 TRINITY_DN10989_c0_g1~~TRINITY_DN10989_c0_g1_i2.p1  ORF type:complete len:669 (+),score=114.18 TRINITY_DN10989_c0_g1_i2:227-2233(+)
MDGIDTEEIERQFNLAMERSSVKETANLSSPHVMCWQLKRPPKMAKGVNLTYSSEGKPMTRKAWRQAGLLRISTGEVGVVILTSGACADDGGTHNTMKEVLSDIGLPSRKTMLRIFCERIRRVEHLSRLAAESHQEGERVAGRTALCADNAIQRQKTINKQRQKWLKSLEHGKDAELPAEVETAIPVYIMVNQNCRQEMEVLFAEESYFGLRHENTLFFDEISTPVLDRDGRILLETKSRIMMRPEGTGGLVRALKASGAFSDMKSRGVQAVYVMSCDNLLSRVADPTFVGICTRLGTHVGVKSAVTQSTEDHMWALVNRLNGKMKVNSKTGDSEEVFTASPAALMLREIHKDVRRQRDKSSEEYLFGTIDIGQYWFTMEAMERISHAGAPPHAMRFAVTHLSTDSGFFEHVGPEEDMAAVHLRSHIQDNFMHFSHIVAFGVERSAEIAFVHSAADAVLAVSSLCTLHYGWIMECGGRFNNYASAGLEKDQRCEISPLVSYDGEGLKGAFNCCSHRPLDFPFHLMANSEAEARFSPSLPMDMRVIETQGLVKYAPASPGDDDHHFPPLFVNAANIMQFKTEAFFGEEGFVPEDCTSAERLDMTPRDIVEERNNWEKQTLEGERTHYENMDKRSNRKGGGAAEQQIIDSPKGKSQGNNDGPSKRNSTSK